MQGTIKTAAQPKLHRVHDTISRHNKQKKRGTFTCIQIETVLYKRKHLNCMT